jgi:hypothetical protein
MTVDFKCVCASIAATASSLGQKSGGHEIKRPNSLMLGPKSLMLGPVG